MKKVLLVKDVMEKNVHTLTEEATIKEAIKILYQKGFSGGPVVDKNGKIIGVISEKDLFKSLYPSYQDLEQEEELTPFSDPAKMEEWLEISGDKKIKEIMSRKVISTTPDTPLVEIGAIMIAEGINRLPVIENGKLIGIVSRRRLYKDIFKHLFDF